MSKALRVIRGGQWHPLDTVSRSSGDRVGYTGAYQRRHLGFRCARAKFTGSGRVYRGGGWGDFAALARAANRNFVSPGDRYGNIGFRTVRRDG